jgi:hypothetical protein
MKLENFEFDAFFLLLPFTFYPKTLNFAESSWIIRLPMSYTTDFFFQIEKRNNVVNKLFFFLADILNNSYNVFAVSNLTFN